MSGIFGGRYPGFQRRRWPGGGRKIRVERCEQPRTGIPSAGHDANRQQQTNDRPDCKRVASREPGVRPPAAQLPGPVDHAAAMGLPQCLAARIIDATDLLVIQGAHRPVRQPADGFQTALCVALTGPAHRSERAPQGPAQGSREASQCQHVKPAWDQGPHP